MTEADRVQFGETLIVLSETFNEPVSEIRVRAYFETLRDLPIEAVVQAARVCLRSSKFFPKPAELREVIEGQAHDEATLAFSALTAEVRRVGYYGNPKLEPRLLEAVRQTWGSWEYLCETLPVAGTTAYDFEAKRFTATYAALSRRELVAIGPSKGEAAQLLKQITSAVKTMPTAKT